MLIIVKKYKTLLHDASVDGKRRTDSVALVPNTKTFLKLLNALDDRAIYIKRLIKNYIFIKN